MAHVFLIEVISSGTPKTKQAFKTKKKRTQIQ